MNFWILCTRTLLLCSVSLLALGCGDKQASSKNREEKPALVNVIQATRAPVVTQQTLPGTLEALHTVHLHAQETGRILTMPYYPGDQVKAGAELIKLDDSLIRAEAQKANAAFRKAELDHKRVAQLTERKLIAEDELVRTQTSLDQARAERDALATRLQHTSIRAPFNGIISERLREPGDVVAIHQHVMTLYNPDKLIIKLAISEIFLASIAPRQKVQIRIDALGEQLHSGFVARIHPTIDPNSRQGIIEVQLSPAPRGARPGQLCRVILPAQSQILLTVPMHTIRTDTQGEYVIRVDDKNIARFVRIKTGKQIDDRIEIIDGLNDGDRVVSEGYIDLRDGKSVAVK